MWRAFVTVVAVYVFHRYHVYPIESIVPAVDSIVDASTQVDDATQVEANDFFSNEDLIIIEETELEPQEEKKTQNTPLPRFRYLVPEHMKWDWATIGKRNLRNKKTQKTF